MRRSRASLAVIALAFLAPWACAETLTVNTTTDDNQANSLCSLREAVEYFNQGRPADGYQGCKAEADGGGAVITLPASDTPYLITGSAIPVRTGLTINGDGRKEVGSITHIQVTGRHRAFIVHDDPQYQAPKCDSDGDCASSPLGSAGLPTFDLDGASDTAIYGGSSTDYLTDLAFPEVKGRLPGISRVPLPANSYLLRVYQVFPSADPVEVGRTTVPFTAADMDWKARLILANLGIVNLRYTIQEVNAAGTEIGDVSDIDASPTLRIALVASPARITLRLTKLMLSGGCEALAVTFCSTLVDDTTTVINPAGAGYDESRLTYRYALSGTDGNGGIIFSTEKVALSDVLIQHGQAEDGGALYSSADGGVEVDNTELRENRAIRGAAIFTESNAAKVTTSLLTENDVLLVTGGTPAVDAGAGGAVIEVGAATVPTDVATTTIQSTTLSGNRGIALSLRTGGVVNGATILSNDGGGVQFNTHVAGVFNSILALNGPNDGSRDCLGLPATPSLANNLVLNTGSCPATDNISTDNQANTDRQLLATLVGGRCSGQWGLLCPLADHGGATFVHMPRVLESYLDSPLGLGASLVINRGDTLANSSVADCGAVDQRGESRPTENCSIGAVELKTVEGEATSTGGVIKQGATWTRLASLDLGDEEFLSAARCELMFPPRMVAGRRYPPASLAPDLARVVADTYAVRDSANPADTVVTAAGCPWVERPAGRGEVTFSPGGEYNYRPTTTFHGLDRFDFRAVTTVSALNVLPADRSRLMKGRIIVEPGAGLTSEKVGGVFDLWGMMVLALAGLAWRRGGQA